MLKASRSRSASRTISISKKVSIEHFLAPSRSRSPDKFDSEVNSPKSEIANSDPQKIFEEAQNDGGVTHAPRSSSAFRVTLASLETGEPIFEVKRRKRPYMKYYWKNRELLILHVVSNQIRII